MKRLALGAGLALAACHRAEPVRHVPLATTAITIDGELSEPDWNRLGDPAAFLAVGARAEARPYSQIRLLADATRLYIGLYAADQDIRATDRFELVLGSVRLAVGPDATLVPPLAGATAARDLDGTIDAPQDEDEEWVIELAVPRSSLPRGTFPIAAARCDTPKGGVPRCGVWARTVELP